MLHRLRLAFTTLPSPRGWALCGAIAAVTGAVMAAIGFTTSLYALTPTAPGLPLRLLAVLFVPALGEEIPFRGLLVPGPDARRPYGAVAISTALYVAWHPLEALTFLPAATMFLRADFLACTAILGLGCGIMRWRTGSLWPAVLLHGGFVVIWQTWLGGFRL